MLQVQIIPRATGDFFRAVVFVKDAKGKNIDADISLVAKLIGGREAIFMAAPKSGKVNSAYPEGGSKFLHRIEKGIYVAQSKSKKLADVREIEVMARVGKERAEKRILI